MEDPLDRWMRATDRLLVEPWKGRIRAFLAAHREASHLLRVDDKVLIAGNVVMINDAFIELLPCEFHPGVGFAVAKPGSKTMRLSLDMSRRSIAPKAGDQIICYGMQVQAASWETLAFGDDAIVVFRAQWRPEEPLHVLHLFSGAYCGWSRALRWMAHALPLVNVATEVCIDHDPKIMEAWSCQHGIRHQKGTTLSTAPVDLASKAGICTSVGDKSLLNCWPYENNAITTASPPCISWSQGGRLLGLNCCEGFAMAETAMLVEVQQPLLIFLEGADTTISHDHFPLVECMLNLVGYRKVWDQVVGQHLLSHNQRTRWLAVWARTDLALSSHESKFELRAPPLVPWHDALNEFWTPESFQTQLQLNDEALKKYGNPGLLPPAKRARSCVELSPTETFHQRIADTNQPLPTLCSSYTKQHTLNVDHIMSKGIFASLQVVNGKICFLCPTRFVPLFGTTDNITLPSDASFAFHILGNAITQSQATLCLAVGLQAIFVVDFAPIQLVRQAWNQRLTSQSALVQVFEQWLTVTKIEDIAATMVPRTLPMSFDGPLLSLEVEHCKQGNVWKAKVPPQASLITTIIVTMFTKGLQPEALCFRTKTHQPVQDIPLVEAFAVSPEITCSIRQCPLVTLRTVSTWPLTRPLLKMLFRPPCPSLCKKSRLHVWLFSLIHKCNLLLSVSMHSFSSWTSIPIGGLIKTRPNNLCRSCGKIHLVSSRLSLTPLCQLLTSKSSLRSTSAISTLSTRVPSGSQGLHQVLSSP